MLFDIRKGKALSLSMNTLFQNPTLREFADVLDAASDVSKGPHDSSPPEMDYHLDAEILNVKSHNQPIASMQDVPRTFFVTGATGFLGAHILADLLNRTTILKVVAHVRASSTTDATQRIKETCEAYDVWNTSWLDSHKLEVVTGDLNEPRLGIDQETWDRLAESVDCVIHNGAKYIHLFLLSTRSIYSATC